MGISTSICDGKNCRSKVSGLKLWVSRNFWRRCGSQRSHGWRTTNDDDASFSTSLSFSLSLFLSLSPTHSLSQSRTFKAKLKIQMAKNFQEIVTFVAKKLQRHSLKTFGENSSHLGTCSQSYKAFTGLYLQVCKYRAIFNITCSHKYCIIQYVNASFHF